jgi:hypothetical protein
MPLHGVPRVAIGHDHYLSRVHDKQDQVCGFVDDHPHAKEPGRQCGGGVFLEGSQHATPGRTWRIVAGDPNTPEMDGLTLEPSLLCTACGDHGWVRDGKWVPA